MRKDADSAEIQQTSLTSNPNISETANHSIINNTIFWKCATSSFRCIYVNYFNILRFLAEVSTKLQILHFFRQFKDRNFKRGDGNYTNNPIFSIYFFSSNCLWHWFLKLKILKIRFNVVPLWSILVCKISHFFFRKLPIQTAHHNFLESRHPEVTKNLYYLSTRRRQIPIF